MHFSALFLVFSVLLTACLCQLLFPGDNEIVHEDVQRTAREEDRLPPHLKNPFYQNPRIRAELAKSSWFGPGERPVKSRDTHTIPRREIFNVLNHAGLLPQQKRGF